jgi:hypothetical protein
MRFLPSGIAEWRSWRVGVKCRQRKAVRTHTSSLSLSKRFKSFQRDDGETYFETGVVRSCSAVESVAGALRRPSSTLGKCRAGQKLRTSPAGRFTERRDESTNTFLAVLSAGCRFALADLLLTCLPIVAAASSAAGQEPTSVRRRVARFASS